MERYALATGNQLGVGDGVVFPRRLRNGDVTRGTLHSTFNNELRALCREAGVDEPPPWGRISSHGTGRRSGASAYARAGANREQLGKVGCWKDLDGIDVYDESGPATAMTLGDLVHQHRTGGGRAAGWGALGAAQPRSPRTSPR